MPTFRYAKLVRDKIRQLHEENGDIVTGKKLSRRELSDALQYKLTEESAELFDAIAIHNIEKMQNELADIYQVLQDLASTLDIHENDIQAAKEQKYSKRGGFLEGQYIETVTIVHDDDPLITRFRADPVKYPEIQES